MMNKKSKKLNAKKAETKTSTNYDCCWYDLCCSDYPSCCQSGDNLDAIDEIPKYFRLADETRLEDSRFADKKSWVEIKRTSQAVSPSSFVFWCILLKLPEIP